MRRIQNYITVAPCSLRKYAHPGDTDGGTESNFMIFHSSQNAHFTFNESTQSDKAGFTLTWFM